MRCRFLQRDLDALRSAHHALATPPVPAGDERERLAERLAGTGSYDFTVQLVDWGDEYREFMLAQADRLLAAGVRLTEGSNQ